MAIKKGDFIEIEYTGQTKEESIVFDTTHEEAAKQHNIYNEHYKYGPLIICVGENQVLKGIDRQLEGKEPGDYTFDIPSDDAFGKKSAKLLRMVPLTAFKKQNIMPYPGLQLNMDGVIGTVKTVTGGRTIVDFNHPLASKDLRYTLKINRIISDDKEKIDSYVKLQLNQKEVDVQLNENRATVTLPIALPKEYAEPLILKLKELTGKDVEFIEKKGLEETGTSPAAEPDAQAQEQKSSK